MIKDFREASCCFENLLFVFVKAVVASTVVFENPLFLVYGIVCMLFLDKDPFIKVPFIKCTSFFDKVDFFVDAFAKIFVVVDFFPDEAKSLFSVSTNDEFNDQALTEFFPVFSNVVVVSCGNSMDDFFDN